MEELEQRHSKGFPEWAMISLIEHAVRSRHGLRRHRRRTSSTISSPTFSRPLISARLVANHHGLPDGSYVHAVREDPKRKGLLYAGTETGAWVFL